MVVLGGFEPRAIIVHTQSHCFEDPNYLWIVIQLKDWTYANKVMAFHQEMGYRLTHYSPVLLFYTPWIHQKTFRFCDVFRGYRKAIPGCNGFNLRLQKHKELKNCWKLCLSFFWQIETRPEKQVWVD